MEDAANAAGFIVVLCNSDDSLVKEQRYLQLLQEQRVQGLLITPVSREASVQRARRHSIKSIFLDHPSRSPDFCSVAVDDALGGDLATSHLLSQGHRRLGFLHGPPTIRQTAQRQRGVWRSVKRFGLDPQTAVLNITTSGQNTAEGEASIDLLFASEQRPTAVFCANDLLALGLMRGLAKQGIRVPQNIAVVGYDDVDFASVLSPPLTTIRQPKYELGYKASQLLLEEIQNPAHHSHYQVLFRPELLVRESSLFQRSS